MAPSRHWRRPRPDHDAGARRHCLCRGVGRPGNLWPLRDDRTSDRLCPVWSQPHHGSGPGLIPGRHHPRRRPSAFRRRSTSGRRVGRHDGHRLGDRVHTGGSGAPRFHNRTALEAHTLWLYERHRAHGPDQPAPEDFRILYRERWAVAKPFGDRRLHPERENELGRVCGWRGQPGRDPPAQGKQAAARESSLQWSARPWS